MTPVSPFLLSGRKEGSPDGSHIVTRGCRWSRRQDSNLRSPAYGAGELATAPLRNGRDGGTRTRDPLLPRQVRYQAALRPDMMAPRAGFEPAAK